MAVSTLRRLAASAPVPVFVAFGPDMRAAAWRLRLDPRLCVVASPRHATVLLVAGRLPADHVPALRRVHDQLPHPRGAVWWSADAHESQPREALPAAVGIRSDPVDAIVDLHRDLVSGKRESGAPLGPDQNPTDWRGVGPHGQGGEGMMGGTPFGRSMAMTGEDIRDGLQLDRVPVTLGPYHGALPPGLVLDLELQGDVIVSCSVRLPGEATLGSDPETPEPPGDPGLLWLSDLLEIHGLDARGRRLARAAFDDTDGGERLARLATRSLAPALRGVGTIDGEDALARVSGVTNDGSSLPRPSPDLLEKHLPGMEWGEAITTIWSLGAW